MTILSLGGKRCRRSDDAVHPPLRIGPHPACGFGCVAMSAAGSRSEAVARPHGHQALRVPASLRRTSTDRLGCRRRRRPREAALVVGLSRAPEVLGTEVYLRATPQLPPLPQLAIQRFDGTRAAGAASHEPLAMRSVRACAVVLHRVPAAATRASVHTIRAYRDALSLLLKFVAKQRGRESPSCSSATLMPTR